MTTTLLRSVLTRTPFCPCFGSPRKAPAVSRRDELPPRAPPASSHPRPAAGPCCEHRREQRGSGTATVRARHPQLLQRPQQNTKYMSSSKRRMQLATQGSVSARQKLGALPVAPCFWRGQALRKKPVLSVLQSSRQPQLQKPIVDRSVSDDNIVRGSSKPLLKVAAQELGNKGLNGTWFWFEDSAKFRSCPISTT